MLFHPSLCLFDAFDGLFDFSEPESVRLYSVWFRHSWDCICWESIQCCVNSVFGRFFVFFFLLEWQQKHFAITFAISLAFHRFHFFLSLVCFLHGLRHTTTPNQLSLLKLIIWKSYLSFIFLNFCRLCIFQMLLLFSLKSAKSIYRKIACRTQFRQASNSKWFQFHTMWISHCRWKNELFGRKLLKQLEHLCGYFCNSILLALYTDQQRIWGERAANRDGRQTKNDVGMNKKKWRKTLQLLCPTLSRHFRQAPHFFFFCTRFRHTGGQTFITDLIRWIEMLFPKTLLFHSIYRWNCDILIEIELWIQQP